MDVITTTTGALSRRSLMKLAFAAACMLPAHVALAGCSSSDASSSASGGRTRDASGNVAGQAGAGAAQKPPAADALAAGSAQAPAATGSGSKSETPRVLVAYFSGTGHTERVAQIAAEGLGADVFVITPTQSYTSDDLNYNNEASRVCAEHDDPNRHVELEAVTPEGFDDYDVVLVGYPIWWQHASWVLDDFVAGSDFTGKDVIPFCTSASSPLGESASDLAALAGTGDWREGVRFSAGAGEDDVRAWAQGLGL